jgi:hypothetical protein
MTPADPKRLAHVRTHSGRCLPCPAWFVALALRQPTLLCCRSGGVRGSLAAWAGPRALFRVGRMGGRIW